MGRHLGQTTADPLAALGWTLDALESGWTPAESYDSSGTYPYVSFPFYDFVLGLRAAIEAAPGRLYLEVGSGIGTKLLIASRLGLDVHGVESRARYLGQSAYLCPEADVEHGDARGYDRYGAYDIVYCYRPMIGEEDSAALEETIASGMRSGAVLFLPMRPAPAGFEVVSGSVSRKA